MNRTDAFRRYQRDMRLFSRDVIGLQLYPYQTMWADYAAEVARTGRTETVVVEMPRQSGKNETSAQLEVNLLARCGRRGGDVVKCAPTWKPQIVNSKLRFDARAKQAQARLPFLAFKPSMGYMYRCHRASIQFLSADPQASVVGATASLLMEVDEAQDVQRDKFNKDFSPMRASTGAPLIAYGTTWTDDTLLAQFKRDVEEGRTPGRVFRIAPELVAEANPRYGDFLESEVRRLGRDHPFVSTQYFLEELAQAGRMLSAQHLEMMLGDHERKTGRADEPQIVAGLDFAGADETAGQLVSLDTHSSRDSVALVIGSVQWTEIAEGLHAPHVRILARYEWVNVNPVALHSALFDLLQRKWRVDRVHADATGIGATSTAFLAEAINRPGRPERVIAVNFDSAWNTHTRLAFNYLAAVNGARLKDYKVPFNPLEIAGTEAPDESDPDKHAWWQRGHAKLEGRPGQKVRAYVPSKEGHDDLLIADMLLVDAAYDVGQPRVVTTGQVEFYG